MNKTWKKKWVSALRSGKFEQCVGSMKTDSGYCCLGVLRHLMYPRSNRMDDEMEYLCADHAKKAGLRYEQQEELANMNDAGKDFQQIAAHIEKVL